MNVKFELLSEIIRTRRSVFPNQYKPGLIPERLIDQIIENAIWAPTHKKTQPWRFVRIKEEKLVVLSAFLSDYYKNNTPPDQFSELKWRKAGEKPLQSAYILAICIERSPADLIPSWEETSALAMSVQNIWLSCTALGIGSYWSTPVAIKAMGPLLGLRDTEECLGIYYMGWAPDVLPASDRKPAIQISRYW
ncbi:MAG: nitroreductase [Saprospiraceae bacterium]|nr:nitroreductase [Saprospiraceae bacterium]